MIKISTNIAALAKSLPKQLTARQRWAASEAINHTANGVRVDERVEMARVFSNPTAYTLRSLYVKSATPVRLTARVWLKDNYATGPDDTSKHFLVPQIFGGHRPDKRFEFMLKRIGVLPSGMQVVPGNSAKLDANGNMSRGEIVQILSYLSAFYLAGSAQNKTSAQRDKMKRGTKSRAGQEYIVVRERRGGVIPGIWRVDYTALGRSIRPVLIFVRTTSYGQRWDFFGVANRSIEQRFQHAYAKAWAASARRFG